MNLYLYAVGGVAPAVYDYDMQTDGVLVNTKHRTARGNGIILIVLKRGEKVPTKEQAKSIALIKAINPLWRVTAYFPSK